MIDYYETKSQPITKVIWALDIVQP